MVVSDKFDGVKLLDRHRQVQGLLEKFDLHAISMKTWTPAQHKKKQDKDQLGEWEEEAVLKYDAED